MARQRLGKKKLKKYSDKFGITFTDGLVRGGTDHRVNLYAADGTRYITYPPYNEITQENLNDN